MERIHLSLRLTQLLVVRVQEQELGRDIFREWSVLQRRTPHVLVLVRFPPN